MSGLDLKPRPSILVEPPKPEDADKPAAPTTEAAPQEPAEAGADSESANQDPEIPEKYRGKSPADLVKLLADQEAMIGRQANEVGAYRKLTTDLIDAKQTTDRDKADQEELPEVTADDLLANPGDKISSVVRAVVQQELKPLTDRMSQAEINDQEQQLLGRFPNAQQTLNSPEFHEWLNRTETRRTKADQVVAKRDYGIAAELLEDYEDHLASVRGTVSEDTEGQTSAKPPQQANVDKARKVATEKGGSADAGQLSGEIITADDVTKLIISDRNKYNSPSFQAKLRKAIQEGRFRA